MTDVELELMRILWPLGEGTVRDVMGELPEERRLAYTSVSTVLRIMEQKGFVTSRKVGRGHVYGPLLAKPTYEATCLDHLVSTVFDDKPETLIRRLLDSAEISPQGLASIRTMLDERVSYGAPD